LDEFLFKKKSKTNHFNTSHRIDKRKRKKPKTPLKTISHPEHIKRTHKVEKQKNPTPEKTQKYRERDFGNRNHRNFPLKDARSSLVLFSFSCPFAGDRTWSRKEKYTILFVDRYGEGSS